MTSSARTTSRRTTAKRSQGTRRRSEALEAVGAWVCRLDLELRRALAPALPETVPVLETDAPDIPPQWLYRTVEQRARGEIARNEPAELPRIARAFRLALTPR